MLPESIEKLTSSLKGLPGVGQRGALKLALDILQMTDEKFEELVEQLSEVRKVEFCENCGFFASQNVEEERVLCEICKNTSRQIGQICLLEKPTDVLTVEKSQIYRGLYHVLGNLISPLDNIFPENTDVGELVSRRIPETLKKVPQIELILFFKAGFAGEATTAYLSELLKSQGLTDKVKITRLAQGLPLYYNPETLDQATMAKALEDRREV